jgi:hypothetical protein
MVANFFSTAPLWHDRTALSIRDLESQHISEKCPVNGPQTLEITGSALPMMISSLESEKGLQH